MQVYENRDENLDETRDETRDENSYENSYENRDIFDDGRVDHFKSGYFQNK